jgi:adenine-specific DNA-methyltransferase
MIELGDKGSIYHTENSQYAFVLEKYNEDVQKKVLELAPKVVICLDTLFKGNDNVKTNAQLKFEDSGISFKTV